MTLFVSKEIKSIHPAGTAMGKSSSAIHYLEIECGLARLRLEAVASVSAIGGAAKGLKYNRLRPTPQELLAVTVCAK